MLRIPGSVLWCVDPLQEDSTSHPCFPHTWGRFQCNIKINSPWSTSSAAIKPSWIFSLVELEACFFYCGYQLRACRDTDWEAGSWDLCVNTNGEATSTRVPAWQRALSRVLRQSQWATPICCNSCRQKLRRTGSLKISVSSKKKHTAKSTIQTPLSSFPVPSNSSESHSQTGEGRTENGDSMNHYMSLSAESLEVSEEDKEREKRLFYLQLGLKISWEKGSNQEKN